jgi:hypothetical protein
MMMDEEIMPRLVDVHMLRKSAWSKDIAPFHDHFMDAMLSVPGPFGFEGAERRVAPEFTVEADGWPNSVAPYNVKGRMRGVKFVGTYNIPDVYGKSGPNKNLESYSGDSLEYQWKLTNKKVDYRFALHKNLPVVINIYEARFCNLSVCYYDFAYQGGYHGDNGPYVDEFGYKPALNQTYNRLKADSSIDVDGWNNIYTLYPAQYWEGGRCIRALGYDRDEVIRRLSGKVPLVRPLLDGVYIVLNDNPDITYDEYYAMNVEYKAILGLE